MAVCHGRYEVPFDKLHNKHATYHVFSLLKNVYSPDFPLDLISAQCFETNRDIVSRRREK